MAISALWKADKIAWTGVEFSMVKNFTMSGGVQNQSETPAGHPYPMFTSNQSQTPGLEFTTPEIDTLVAAVPLSGASVSAATVYLKAAAVTGSTARATTGHKRVAIATGCAYWSTIRLPHNGQAEATVMIRAGYDGTNDPFVYTGSVALSGNLSAGTWFGAGPVKINGTTIGGVQEVTIDSGIQLIEAGGESEEFNTFVGIQVARPTITIKLLNEVNWSSVGLRGTTLDGSNGLLVYARKYSNGASRVANATTSHVKFVALNGLINPGSTTAQMSMPTSDTIICHPTAVSDSVLPIVCTTGVAIS